eukprot:COSAG01_NODE_65417_length_273_cov_0.873563_1_plen_44_part_10
MGREREIPNTPPIDAESSVDSDGAISRSKLNSSQSCRPYPKSPP